MGEDVFKAHVQFKMMKLQFEYPKRLQNLLFSSIFKRCFVQNCYKHSLKLFYKMNSDQECAVAVLAIASVIKKKNKRQKKEKTKNCLGKIVVNPS